MSTHPLLRLKERDVSQEVCQFLQWRGWRLIRNTVLKIKIDGRWMQTCEVGMPDYLALRYTGTFTTHHLWLEFKSATGRLRPGQAEWHDAEAQRGAQIWLVSSYEQFEAEYKAAFEGEDSPLKGQRRF